MPDGPPPGARRAGEGVGLAAMREDLRREAQDRVSAFRACTDAVLTFDREELAILTVNPATEALFGRPEGDLLGQPVGVLFSPGPDLEGEDRLADFIPPQIFDGSSQEVWGRRADGSIFPLEIVVTDVDRGESSFYVAHLRDIGERKRREEALRDSEARFRAAVETLGEGLLITDRADRILYVNSTLCHITGYAPEELVGQRVAELLVGPDQREQYRERSELLRQQGFSEQYELSLCTRAGTPVWAEVNATPFRGPHGEVIGSLAAVMDITERKRIQEELVAAVDASQDANRAKSAFLANMSHELRTPLNAIIGYSEMLAEELSERDLEELQPDLQKIHNSGKHLLRLINDILDLSKIEAGKMELFVETFDVPALIREVASTIAPLAARRNNALEVSCPEDTGGMRADLTRVRQVLLNLAGNATKFTENGTVGLEVERTRQAMVFRIRDTGIGMTEDQIGRLFQAFTQADVSTTRKYGGTGLGLVISRQLCQKMGGDLTVESEYGRGSVFTVRLPVNVDVPLAPEVPPPSAPVVSAAGPPTVLVVDDDRLVRDLLQRFLIKEGFRVATAADGEEALRQVREIHPTVVTLDAVMPGLDGWEVLRILKDDPTTAEIPVVMITIVDNPAQGYALGCAEYLTKPVDWRRLGAVLTRFRPVDSNVTLV